MLVTVTSREIEADAAKRKTHLCALNYREFFSSELHMKLACIKSRTYYWDRKAYVKCRHRSDAAEKRGMELVRGNREHGNLETLLGHKTCDQ